MSETAPDGRWVRVQTGHGERWDWVPVLQPESPDGRRGSWHVVSDPPGTPPQWIWFPHQPPPPSAPMRQRRRRAWIWATSGIAFGAVIIAIAVGAYSVGEKAEERIKQEMREAHADEQCELAPDRIYKGMSAEDAERAFAPCLESLTQSLANLKEAEEEFAADAENAGWKFNDPGQVAEDICKAFMDEARPFARVSQDLRDKALEMNADDAEKIIRLAVKHLCADQEFHLP